MMSINTVGKSSIVIIFACKIGNQIHAKFKFKTYVLYNIYVPWSVLEKYLRKSSLLVNLKTNGLQFYLNIDSFIGLFITVFSYNIFATDFYLSYFTPNFSNKYFSDGKH